MVFPMTSHLSVLNSTYHFTAQLLRVLLFPYATSNDNIIHRLYHGTLCQAVYKTSCTAHTWPNLCWFWDCYTPWTEEVAQTSPIAGRTLPVGRECPLITCSLWTKPADLHCTVLDMEDLEALRKRLDTFSWLGCTSAILSLNFRIHILLKYLRLRPLDCREVF